MLDADAKGIVLLSAEQPTRGGHCFPPSFSWVVLRNDTMFPEILQLLPLTPICVGSLCRRNFFCCSILQLCGEIIWSVALEIVFWRAIWTRGWNSHNYMEKNLLELGQFWGKEAVWEGEVCYHSQFWGSCFSWEIYIGKFYGFKYALKLWNFFLIKVLRFQSELGHTNCQGWLMRK